MAVHDIWDIVIFHKYRNPHRLCSFTLKRTLTSLCIYLVLTNLHKIVYSAWPMQLHQNYEKPLKDGQLYKTDTLARPERCPS